MKTTEKRFDAFVSYSHRDRKSILKIAERLTQRRIRTWYDGWEMKPGDVLRERINSGIENADYFVAVLSENSLDSSWVRFELNSAMLREIEERHVRVIPSIIGAIDFSDLPFDLRAKYCLDFRTKESFDQSIDALTDLIQPERRLRKQLLARLRAPVDINVATVSELREYAVQYHDQAIQVAAIQGLEKIGGKDAVLVLTQRVLDPWGVHGIRRTIGALANLAQVGGLLPLVATLSYDFRFYKDKLASLCNAADRMGMTKVAAALKTIYDRSDRVYPPSAEYDVRDALPKALSQLKLVRFDDIRYGAVMAQAINPLSGSLKKIKLPEQKEVDEAITFAERRLPGITAILKNNPSKMWRS